MVPLELKNDRYKAGGVVKQLEAGARFAETVVSENHKSELRSCSGFRQVAEQDGTDKTKECRQSEFSRENQNHQIDEMRKQSDGKTLVTPIFVWCVVIPDLGFEVRRVAICFKQVLAENSDVMRK